jgi:hypothetical protein
MLLRAIYPLYDVAGRRRWRIDQPAKIRRARGTFVRHFLRRLALQRVIALAALRLSAFANQSKIAR